MPRLRAATLALLLVLAHAAAAAAAEADPARADSLGAAWEEEVEEQRSWLGRLLHRFFGRAPQSGDESGGRTEQVVDRYREHAGKRIDVVIIHPVLRFEESVPDTGADDATAWLNSLAGRFRSYTRAGVIRNYLLFARGETIDPYDLADSERLLRGLEYVNDARIVVLPVGGADEGVAVVVEYRDRWPFGVRGNVKDADRFEAGAYSTNVGGLGVRLDQEIILNRGGDPRWGYAGALQARNLGGSFVDGALEYEDSWRALTRGASLDRRNSHPGIRIVGGLGWAGSTVRDNGGEPLRYEDSDVWAGRVVPLSADRRAFTGGRRTLTPAVSYARRLHLDRPVVRPDTNGFYHDRETYLVGLTYQRITDVKTSYLFRMGEAEDLPAGMSIKLSSGYADGEFRRRTPFALRTAGILAAERGDVLYGGIGVGGYWRDRRFEDGVLDVDLTYITPLLGGSLLRSRVYGTAGYTLGLARRERDGLVLSDRTGIRGLGGARVRGDQRLTLGLEWRTFTLWRLLGFRVMTFLYGDAGMVGDEHASVLANKVYTSLGAGVRFNNPDLVLPTVEVRFGVIQLVDRSAFGLAFDLGNAQELRVTAPGVRPGLVAYE